MHQTSLRKKLFSFRIKRIQDTTFQQKGTETTSSVSSFEDKGSCRQNY